MVGVCKRVGWFMSVCGWVVCGFVVIRGSWLVVLTSLGCGCIVRYLCIELEFGILDLEVLFLFFVLGLPWDDLVMGVVFLMCGRTLTGNSLVIGLLHFRDCGNLVGLFFRFSGGILNCVKINVEQGWGGGWLIVPVNLTTFGRGVICGVGVVVVCGGCVLIVCMGGIDVVVVVVFVHSCCGPSSFLTPLQNFSSYILVVVSSGFPLCDSSW